MEISVINRISDFEAGINSLNKLNNPSFPSKVFAVSGIEKIYPAYHFWKWGAFILAMLASLSTIINRLKILIVRFRQNHSLQSPQTLLYDTDFDTDTDDDDDTSSCSSSENEEEEEEEEEEYEEPSQNWRRVDEDFRVKGSGHFVDDDQWRNGKFTLRKRRSSISDLFSWAEELTSGKSVVKLWDNLGLGVRFDLDESDAVLNVYDVNKETKIRSIFGGKSDFQALTAPSSSSSPSVVLSACADSSTPRVAVSAWDTRLPGKKPVILREWSPEKPVEKISAVKVDGVEKVYFRGDVKGKLTVGDMRKVGSPLRNLTDTDVETWWDADAVIVSNELM